MMMNLFIMFDPSTNIFNMNWLVLSMPLLFINKNYYYVIGRFSMMLRLIIEMVISDLKNNLKKSHFKSLIFFVMLFSMIYVSNLVSLFPYIFAPTSHMSITMFLAFSAWFSLIMKGWVKDTGMMFSHLVPQGSPVYLSPFMVIIETISMIIRPLTLSIRLSANMIAGHILISLISSLLSSGVTIYFFCFFVVNTLLVLEIAVAIIQGYVFIILLSLYLNEIN